MPNLTQVTLTNGVPTAGNGTVSTPDGVWQTANGPIAIKPASTPAASTDTAMVVAIHPLSTNANGAATSANSSPVVIATDQATLAVAQDVTQLSNGVTGTTVAVHYQTITASTSGATTIVTGTGGKKITVIQWIVKVNAAVNFKWQSHTTPTDLTGLFYNSGQGDGAGGAFCPLGHFQTLVGESLDINLSGNVAVGGSLVYVLV